MWTWVFFAFAFGLLIGAFVARVQQRRAHLRALKAEHRARQAEKLAEVGAMTAGLAHEIKNPLSTIGLNAQLLAEAINDTPIDADNKPRLLNRVGTLKRETDRLRGILQDFLDYAGQIRLDKRPTDLNAVCEELVDFLTPEAERALVRLRLDAARESLIAPVDVRLLKQAVLNLLLNAIHAVSHKPGASAAGTRGEVILKATGTPTAAEIHVIDTGPGIDTDTQAKVFQPYFTTKSGGTGLGLPTSRRYIEEHGGTLTLRSTPGMGSDFTITLPIES